MAQYDAQLRSSDLGFGRAKGTYSVFNPLTVGHSNFSATRFPPSKQQL
jgi:hypothetical protein